MPIHDWTRVNAGIFYSLHHGWISEISRSLNRKLPPGYYALPEQIASDFGPDVLTLKSPTGNGVNPADGRGGITVAEAAPKVRFRLTAREERDEYAKKAKVVKVRHTSDHAVVAVVEIVSPGNKSSRAAFLSFVEKAHSCYPPASTSS